MNLIDAQTMATSIMREHNLTGWTFGFNRRKTANGLCYEGRKLIELSVYFVEHNTPERVKMTILHEVAHALAGHAAGHGPKWQRICVAIGGNGQRCNASEHTEKVSYAWTGTCPGGHTHQQHRAPLRVKACGQCATKWKPENIIVWHQHGRKVRPNSISTRYANEYRAIQIRYGALLPA